MFIDTIALPIALGVFVALVLVYPLIRHRRRTGAWALVVRPTSDSVESLVRWWTLGLLGATALWAILVPTLGAASLGAWAVAPAVSWIGVGLLGIAFGLIVAAQAQMGNSWRIGIDDAPTALVTSGLFRYVRHPIYSGILLLSAGIVLITPAPWTVAGALLGYVLVAIQARLEEQHLARQHGEAYRQWAARVGRFVPNVG